MIGWCVVLVCYLAALWQFGALWASVQETMGW